MKAINQLLQCLQSLLDILKENIEVALADDNTGELEKINAILTQKQKELVRLAHAKNNYTVCSCSNDGYVWMGKLEKQLTFPVSTS